MLDMNIECVCPKCGAINLVTVCSDDYVAWLEGKHAQDAFPYLSAYERETLISGFCLDCWNHIFGKEEDE